MPENNSRRWAKLCTFILPAASITVFGILTFIDSRQSEEAEIKSRERRVRHKKRSFSVELHLQTTYQWEHLFITLIALCLMGTKGRTSKANK